MAEKAVLKEEFPSKSRLEGRGLCKSYTGRAIVKNVDFYVERGEVVGLLGPNGAGKTTSFYMLAGLAKVDAGHILLDGQTITEEPLPARALRGVGYLPQEASIFRDLSVEANIYAALENRPLPKTKKKNLLDSLIADFGLDYLRSSKGSILSGGERRRVEIARVLALEPRFILLDEPFAGVDPLAVSDIQGIIEGLKERNIGVLITDHSVRETLETVDRAYIMSSGELLVSGTPKEIVENPKAKELYFGEEFNIR